MAILRSGCETGAMPADDQQPSGPPPANGWGLTIAMVLTFAIAVFTWFEIH
jgi:hypothetical protein